MNVLTGGDATTALCSLLNALLASGSGVESEVKGVYRDFLFDCIVLYCIELYCIVLYCVVLYSIVFYSIPFCLHEMVPSNELNSLFSVY